MKQKQTAFLCGLALALSCQSTLAADPLLPQARSAAAALGKQLKSEVMKSMKEKGPGGTIAFCSQRAPAIARDVSRQTGWHAGRTSLKYRNPSNAPDQWEQAVLKTFEQRKAAGEPIDRLEHGEVVEQNGRKVYRYMKAIGTGKPCLHCHGTNIKPEIQQTLDTLYPSDRARGFQLGDIRGAFTLSKEL